MFGTKLFHVSEEGDLHHFHPRPVPAIVPGLNGPKSLDGDVPVVWAVDELHLPNYLLPRECPRVCFAPDETTTQHDRDQFFAAATPARIIAVEAQWYERISACTLFLYELPPDAFVLHDKNAGYWVSGSAVESIAKIELGDLVDELLRRDVELRFLQSLWPLWETIRGSSLSFSMIRMRNAQPRADCHDDR